jgi:hypothetical protein
MSEITTPLAKEVIAFNKYCLHPLDELALKVQKLEQELEKLNYTTSSYYMIVPKTARDPWVYCTNSNKYTTKKQVREAINWETHDCYLVDPNLGKCWKAEKHTLYT